MTPFPGCAHSSVTAVALLADGVPSVINPSRTGVKGLVSPTNSFVIKRKDTRGMAMDHTPIVALPRSSFSRRQLSPVLGSVCAVLLPSAALAAGNVLVTEQNGNLIIQGDTASNNIIVTENGVIGRGGTTVNGERGVFFPDATNDVRIDMKSGHDFIRVTQFFRSEFLGKFLLRTGIGDDLFEFHNTKFYGEVDVTLGGGNDGACATNDSEFVMPQLASFDGGSPGGFPGDGFVSPSLEFTLLAGFEFYPDDCSYLGGRF